MKAQHNYYYDIKDDLKAYPDNWCYLVVGGRNTGKTYSALRYMIENNIKFVFVKRTIKDVQTLCAGNKIGTHKDENAPDIDFSPFKALNRDFGWNIKAFSIPKVDGMGGFWNCDPEGNPIGSVVGYIAALSAVDDVKGFDLSDCKYMIFDEFIPQPWERVSRSEGNQVMDLYKTILRDREHRGLPPLILIALANAVNISNPLMNILEVTDQFAELSPKNCIQNIKSRGILLHQILDNEAFVDTERSTALYKAMSDTNWGRMAFENQFAYNDFSSISKQALKEYRPRAEIIYKRQHWFLYSKGGHYYICTSKCKTDHVYDLNRENSQKLFFEEWYTELRYATMEDKMLFQKYTMYDVIVNFKQFFKV